MPVTALVTLAETKTHLNILSSDTTNDTELQGYIDAATGFVQFQTGPIIPVTYTEVHDGGGPRIVLHNPPILTMTSVTEYIGPTGNLLTQCELGATTGQYSYSIDDTVRGIIVRRYNGGFVGAFAAGVRNIQVVYQAGLAAVPPEVRLATLLDIQGLWQQTQRGSSTGRPVPTGDGFAPDAWGGPPITMFPRLGALLSGPSRTPSIA